LAASIRFLRARRPAAISGETGPWRTPEDDGSSVH
jgi:hypothetical protein